MNRIAFVLAVLMGATMLVGPWAHAEDLALQHLKEAIKIAQQQRHTTAKKAWFERPPFPSSSLEFELFHTTVINNDLEAFQFLTDHWSDLNFDTYNEDHVNILMLTAWYNRFDMFEHFLKIFAYPKIAKDKKGRNILFYIGMTPHQGSKDNVDTRPFIDALLQTFDSPFTQLLALDFIKNWLHKSSAPPDYAPDYILQIAQIANNPSSTSSPLVANSSPILDTFIQTPLSHQKQIYVFDALLQDHLKLLEPQQQTEYVKKLFAASLKFGNLQAGDFLLKNQQALLRLSQLRLSQQEHAMYLRSLLYTALKLYDFDFAEHVLKNYQQFIKSTQEKRSIQEKKSTPQQLEDHLALWAPYHAAMAQTLLVTSSSKASTSNPKVSTSNPEVYKKALSFLNFLLSKLNRIEKKFALSLYSRPSAGKLRITSNPIDPNFLIPLKGLELIENNNWADVISNLYHKESSAQYMPDVHLKTVSLYEDPESQLIQKAISINYLQHVVQVCYDDEALLALMSSDTLLRLATGYGLDNKKLALRSLAQMAYNSCGPKSHLYKFLATKSECHFLQEVFNTNKCF